MNNYTPVFGQGFVGLVDTMGGDSSVVQAARVSYGKGTKAVSEDQKLIRYLMRNHHWTPFEMVQFKFHVACPISIARQWFRHRTGSFNEYSLRYSEAIDAVYVPNDARYTVQSRDNKQGSGEELVGDNTKDVFNESIAQSTSAYRELITLGVNRETARGVLPMNQFTEFYWSVNLRNLLHFIGLRIDSHAQQEIRDYAFALAHFVEKNNPDSWDAWVDYSYKSPSFTPQELGWYAKEAGGLEDHQVFGDTPKRLVNEYKAKVERSRSDLVLPRRNMISAEAARCLLHGTTPCY